MLKRASCVRTMLIAAGSKSPECASSQDVAAASLETMKTGSRPVIAFSLFRLFPELNALPLGFALERREVLPRDRNRDTIPGLPRAENAAAVVAPWPLRKQSTNRFAIRLFDHSRLRSERNRLCQMLHARLSDFESHLYFCTTTTSSKARPRPSVLDTCRRSTGLPFFFSTSREWCSPGRNRWPSPHCRNPTTTGKSA